MKRTVRTMMWVLAFTAAIGAVQADRLVICAPGYPGNTEQARETMDAFAAAVAAGAGWPESGLVAEYHERADAGRERIRDRETVLALVTLPFFLEYGGNLDLRPHLQGVREEGAMESWSLAVPAGKVKAPADLAGWELAGVPGYSPAFVRGAVLGGWGDLPADVEIRFTARALSSLRQASRGESVAVLLDDAQAGALSSLPYGEQLEIVWRSEPAPASLLCTVGDRLAEKRPGILEALRELHREKRGAAALHEIRLQRFEAVDPAVLATVRESFEKAGGEKDDR